MTGVVDRPAGEGATLQRHQGVGRHVHCVGHEYVPAEWQSHGRTDQSSGIDRGSSLVRLNVPLLNANVPNGSMTIEPVESGGGDDGSDMIQLLSWL